MQRPRWPVLRKLSLYALIGALALYLGMLGLQTFWKPTVLTMEQIQKMAAIKYPDPDPFDYYSVYPLIGNTPPVWDKPSIAVNLIANKAAKRKMQEWEEITGKDFLRYHPSMQAHEDDPNKQIYHVDAKGDEDAQFVNLSDLPTIGLSTLINVFRSLSDEERETECLSDPDGSECTNGIIFLKNEQDVISKKGVCFGGPLGKHAEDGLTYFGFKERVICGQIWRDHMYCIDRAKGFAELSDCNLYFALHEHLREKRARLIAQYPSDLRQAEEARRRFIYARLMEQTQ